MAASICCISTNFYFSINVQNLTSTNVRSSELILSDVKWKVNIARKSSGYVAVYLESELDKIATDDKWSCEAQAAFKLHHKDGQNDKSIVKYLSRQEFTDENPCCGIEEFIEWNEFVEHFVVDNEATFEIEISTNPKKPTPTPASNVDQRCVKFRVMIENVSQLKTIHTPEIVVGGLRWKVKIQKGIGTLGIFLCTNTNDMTSNWSYNVNAIFTLFSYRKDTPSLIGRFERNFRRELSCDWGYPKLISWEDFIDKDKNYVLDDCVNLEFEVKVDKPKANWEIGQSSLSKANSKLKCCICYDSFPSGKIFSTRCGHLFCQPCFKESIESNPICSMCKADTDLDELHPVFF